MTSFKRKLRRKQTRIARKEFMRHFKESMANFKSQVKCTKCDRPPNPDESIDNWTIDQNSDNINLICNTCSTPPGDENEV